MKKQIKLISAIKVFFFAALILLTVLIVALQISHSRQQFAERAQQLRTDHVAQKKAMIKQEVMQVVNLINFKRNQSYHQAQQITKQRVYQAHAIAQRLYDQFQMSKPASEVKKIIIETLRALRYPQDDGYYFITSLDGVAVLFADRPQLEGENLLNIQDPTGKFVVKDMIDIANQHGEGEYTYQWTKPNAPDRNYAKTAYIKRFTPYNWFIGTGLYVDDVENGIQNKLLEMIAQIRFGENGYIFVNRLNGDVLSTQGKHYFGKKKLWELFDKNPQKIKNLFSKEYAAATKPNGDFIYYTFEKMASSGTGLQEYNKASFIYGIQDWQWLVGAGVYLDEVEAQISVLENHQARQLHKDIKATLLAAVILLLVFLWLFHVLSRLLLGDFAHFVTLVSRASTGGQVIDGGQIRFIELANMAADVNTMLQNKIDAQRDLMAEKENLSTTLNSIGDAVIAADIEGNIVSMNPVAEHLTGWTIDDAYGVPLTEVFKIVNGITRVQAVNPVAQVLRDGKLVEIANHTVLIAKDGSEYHIADSAAPIHDSSGSITGVVLVFRDVSNEYFMRQQLARSEKRYRTFFENSSDPMLIINNGIFVDCNNAAAELLGYADVNELLRKHPAKLSPQMQPDGESSVISFKRLIAIALASGSHCFEWNHLAKSGDIIQVEVSLTAIPTEDGTVLHTVWRDIAARKLAMTQLKHLAHHHPLTGLPNRLLLSARLEYAIQYAKREGVHGAVLFLDLDDFKKINDSLGHNAGDKVLKIAAARLQEHGREIDTVAHISGDEFVIILQSISAVNDAVLRAKQVLWSMQQPFIVDDYELFISCSIGIVEFDGNSDGMDTLLKNADAAMYQAKANGKNSYQLYSAHFTETVMAKVVLEAQLRRALERNELVVHYQPQVKLPEGKIVAVEALMRWQHPELGLIPPNEFIPLSEETGLIVPMGEWIMREACTQFVAWRDLGYDIHRVAVNLSGKQLHLETLPQTVLQILRQTGCPAYALELEITEGFIMQHPERTIAMLQQIRELGIEMSVDDFGTGHSSLNYLKRLPINRLKIDCSFVWDIGENVNGETLVKSIINLGHSLNLQVTAEGIENSEQREFLENLNCNEGQGYLFSKPRPACEIGELLSKQK